MNQVHNGPSRSINSQKEVPRTQNGNNIRNFPRPNIVAEKTIHPEYHSGAYSFESPPPTHYRSQCEDLGQTPCRYLRLSQAKISQDSENNKKKHLPIGLTLTPFAEPLAGEEGIPQTDYHKGSIPRCGRCSAFVNPNFTVMENGQKFKCNLCNLDNAMLPEWRQTFENSEAGPGNPFCLVL
jgi:hypothetical protein